MSPMDRIGIEQENYMGEYCGYTMILQGVKGKAIKDSNTLTFTVKGFTKKEEAEEFARKFRNNLMLSLLESRVTADLMEEEAKTTITTNGEPFFRKLFGISEEAKLLPDKNLTIYEDTPQIVFYDSYAKANRILSDYEGLLTSITEGKYDKAKPNDREVIAYNLLYISSVVAEVPMARFLLAYFALEALICRRKRSSDEAAAFNKAKEIISKASEISKEHQVILCEVLSKGLQESMRKLMTDHFDCLKENVYAGYPLEKFLKICNEIRNEIAHKGYSRKSDVELGSIACELEKLITERIMHEK